MTARLVPTTFDPPYIPQIEETMISLRHALVADNAFNSVPKIVWAAMLATSVAVAHAADPTPAEQKPLPVAAVDALNALSGGPHAGFRANHAKGILTTGTFVPSKDAASLSQAPHFSKSVPVLVRFSDPTGVPNLPDADPNASPHGLAIRFQLPDGGNTDIVCISA